MKHLTLMLFSVQVITASEISLETFIESAKSTQRLQNILEEQQKANHAQTMSSIQTQPFNVYYGATQVDAPRFSQLKKPITWGLEHEISLSKEVTLGKITSYQKQEQTLESQANYIEGKKEILSVKNQLKNLYHQYCLEEEYLSSITSNNQRLSQLYAKKQIAFSSGEIAKPELLQLELEKRALESKEQSVVQKIESDRKLLLSLSNLDSNAQPSCQDLYPIAPSVQANENDFSLSTEAYEHRLQSKQVGLKQYNNEIKKVEFSVGYTKELDQNLYTVGIAVPLDFLSSTNEHKRASLMHQSSALMLQHEEQMSQKTYQKERLLEELKQQYNEIASNNENIEKYQNELLPLMKKSYDYGESSVIEYLLSQQKLFELQERVVELKKAYYRTLFNFYTVSETEESLS